MAIVSFMRPRLLKHQLDSIIRQQIPREELEILVLNDGLEDDTAAVCESFTDRLNIRHIFTGQRNLPGERQIIWRGLGFAANVGVQQAAGDIFIQVDAEVYHLGDTLRLMMATVENNPNAVVFPDHNILADDGRVLKYLDDGGPLPIPNDLLTNLQQYEACLGFLYAVRRSAVLEIGGYDEDFTGSQREDVDFMLRLKGLGIVPAQVPVRLVHLYHERVLSDDPPRMAHNRKVFDAKRGQIRRNVGRPWGIIRENEREWWLQQLRQTGTIRVDID